MRVHVVQQLVLHQILEAAERHAAMQQGRRRHREQFFIQQMDRLQTLERSGAEADGEIDVFAREIHEPPRGIDAQVDAGILRAETTQPRHQPAGRE